MLNKLSNKLIISYIALVVILVVTVLLIFENLLKDTHIDLIKHEMARYDQLLHYTLNKNNIKSKPSTEFSKTIAELAVTMKLRITIILYDGTVIADSDVQDISTLDNHFYRKEVNEALYSGTGYTIRYSNTLKTDMLYYAVRYDIYIIRLAKSLHDVDQGLNSLKKQILYVSIFVIIASLIIIIIVSLKITKPFNTTLNFAYDFTSGNLKRRILNYSKDEIGLLQRALNKMADTICETIDEHIFEKKKLETTLENITDGIAMIDAEKRILIANSSFSKMLNINIDIIYRQYFEIIRNRTINTKIEKVFQSGEKDIFDVEFPPDRFYETVISPIRGEKTNQGILIVIHDISERKRIERIKTDLVSNVSHELKTPIAIVRGYLETIREYYDDKNLAEEFINRAIENVNRQNALIQDIIKLSMIESSKEFEKEEIDLQAVIMRCLELLTPKIVQKEIQLTTDFIKNDDFRFLANLFLVEEIFFNIIDNAINYNHPGGSISIEAEKYGEYITFNISDSGIGIPVESIDRIFERFYRVDKSRSRATGGTGLGLSIVKHAIQALGWDISVNSSRKGTTFTITARKQQSI